MRKNAKGFTLLELMITVGIIVFVIAGLFSSFVYAVLLNDTNSNLLKASYDAQYVLEQMKGVSYSSLAAYTPPVFNNLQNESVTVSKSIGLRIAEVTANVTWIERKRSRNFTLKTRIAR